MLDPAKIADELEAEKAKIKDLEEEAAGQSEASATDHEKKFTGVVFIVFHQQDQAARVLAAQPGLVKRIALAVLPCVFD